MTKREKIQPLDSDKKLKVFILGRAVYEAAHEGREEAASTLPVPRGPCREQWARPVAGNPSDCQVLSCLSSKQAMSQ